MASSKVKHKKRPIHFLETSVMTTNQRCLTTQKSEDFELHRVGSLKSRICNLFVSMLENECRGLGGSSTLSAY